MISKVAIGTAEIPESAPAEPVEVVIPLSNPMSSATSYIVEVLRPATLPAADVAVTDQSATDVTLTVTRPDGFAGTPGLTVYVLCTEDLNYFVDGPGDISGLLDAGWTGSIWLYKEAANVYLQVDLTATASIDGITKDTTIPLLTGLDAAYSHGIYGLANVFFGSFYDETNQPILVKAVGSGTDLSVEGGAGVTDPWTDGVSRLKGQVTWLALDPQPV